MGHGFGTRLPLCRALKGEQWSDRLRLRVRGYSRLRPEQEQSTTASGPVEVKT